MNQNQIQQLTSQLSQALDQNYDVVNMEAVLSVICALEGTTITKEQLEATRLAKYINQLRRRTKNDQLARRAKSLLKKWREMVGIHQQTPNDSQHPQFSVAQSPSSSSSSFKPIGLTNQSESESNTTETMANSIPYTMQPSSSPTQPPLQRINSDFQCNMGSSESHYRHHHTNFPSSIKNNVNIDNSDESLSAIGHKHPVKLARSKPIFVNEHSSNSVSNVLLLNDKLKEASIVIDIVSDSDESESVVNNQQPKLTSASSTSLATPPTANYSRPKKLKKDKKRKERDGREKSLLLNVKNETIPESPSKLVNRSNLNNIPVNDVRIPKPYSTDPEILSLSNSSMSSILSGDAVSGNTQSRLRNTTASDLTFAGRFKSISRAENLNDIINGQKVNIGHGSMELACKDLMINQPICEDYINNDSSTSCSRLSPYEDAETKLTQNHAAKICDDAIPKKRGRKKGSKGVDSLIAKESSLSQQIFFGTGTKKVKTTKELFNEMQSRKLSISFTRGESTLKTTVTNPVANNNSSSVRNQETRSLPIRPTSSCSETSIHSPRHMEAFSTNISLAGTEKLSNTFDDLGNTDSDTMTSELSRDSLKSRQMKRMHSIDSNSNSLQTVSAKSTEDLTLKTSYNDVTTQLMNIVRSLNSPLTVEEAEKQYQAQIVPCTCVIVEDKPEESGVGQDGININNSDTETTAVLKRGDSSDEVEQNDMAAPKIDRACPVVEKVSSSAAPVAATLAISQKPVKSIFDLDFDENDDPLQTIIKSISSPVSTGVKSTLASNANDYDDLRSSSIAGSADDRNQNKDMKGVNDGYFDNEFANIISLEPVSVYTVHEDPDCIAKKRFEVQTNDVTDFHINALHNYYIPNINGNWNNINSSLILTTTSISEFLQTFESYSVSDGSDVVPNYGSLSYDQRIRKDLSFLKFARKSKTKKFKSFLLPFLGVAKCLPTCRLAAKRHKDKTKLLTNINNIRLEKSDIYCNYFNNNQSSPHPLRVEVEADEEDNNDRSLYFLNEKRSEENTTISYNLLKVVNEDRLTVADAKLLKTGDCCANNKTSNGNSNCSDFSSQLYQDLSNENLRIQPAVADESRPVEYNVIERNRKKRRKPARQEGSEASKHDEHNLTSLTVEEKPRIKRIKIAINGSVANQRQISSVGSSNDGDEVESGTPFEGYSQWDQAVIDGNDEYEEGEESNRSHSTTMDEDGVVENYDNDDNNSNDDDDDNEQYAVVQKPNEHGIGVNNHIVLTIKKTPSKINSPVNSMASASPIVVVVNAPDEVTNEPLEYDSAEEELQKTFEKSETCHKYRYRYRRRRRRHQSTCRKDNIDLELKHIFNNNKVSCSDPQLFVKKTHRKLFFANELYRQDRAGRKERIINYSSSSSSSSSSSCSSNSSDSSSSSNEDEDSESGMGCGKISLAKRCTVKNKTDSKTCLNNQQPTENQYLYSSDESITDDEDDDGGPNVITNDDNPGEKVDEKPSLLNNELRLENNGMLPSFNSITIDDQSNDPNICYNNNNNLTLINNHYLLTSEILNNGESYSRINEAAAVGSECANMDYRTGFRVVPDDAPNGTICNRVQQFKEWHQVLQLQSYNNEPLIVLPYVVLE